MTDHQARELLADAERFLNAGRDSYLYGFEYTNSANARELVRRLVEALSTRPTINPTTYEQEHNNTSEHNDT